MVIFSSVRAALCLQMCGADVDAMVCCTEICHYEQIFGVPSLQGDFQYDWVKANIGRTEELTEINLKKTRLPPPAETKASQVRLAHSPAPLCFAARTLFARAAAGAAARLYRCSVPLLTVRMCLKWLRMDCSAAKLVGCMLPSPSINAATAATAAGPCTGRHALHRAAGSHGFGAVEDEQIQQGGEQGGAGVEGPQALHLRRGALRVLGVCLGFRAGRGRVLGARRGRLQAKILTADERSTAWFDPCRQYTILHAARPKERRRHQCYN